MKRNLQKNREIIEELENEKQETEEVIEDAKARFMEKYKEQSLLNI